MVKAVIFDFDGILVDSHGIINNLFTKIANKELGLDISEEEFAQYPGMRFEHRLEKICKDKKIDVTFERILEVISKGRIEYFTNSSYYVRLFPGAKELLEELKGSNIKIALGSNGSRKTILKISDSLGITKYYSSIVTYDDVEKGKPFPDIFLKNAANLGLSPEECLVIEDAQEGLHAAKKAGMKVIAVMTTQKKEDLKEADKIVCSIRDITIKTISELA